MRTPSSIRRRFGCAAVLTLALLALPAITQAGFPIGGNSTVPACISLVGTNGAGVPDPVGAFTVVIRDLANNPIAGALVRVDLSGATDLRLATTQQAGLTVVSTCGAMYVEGLTDANGQITMTLVGSSNAAGGVSSLDNGRVYADGVLQASPTVSVYDLDGHDGVGSNDFSLWFGDFASGSTHGRSDYDCSGSIGANDL